MTPYFLRYEQKSFSWTNCEGYSILWLKGELLKNSKLHFQTSPFKWLCKYLSLFLSRSYVSLWLPLFHRNHFLLCPSCSRVPLNHKSYMVHPCMLPLHIPASIEYQDSYILQVREDCVGSSDQPKHDSANASALLFGRNFGQSWIGTNLHYSALTEDSAISRSSGKQPMLRQITEASAIVAAQNYYFSVTLHCITFVVDK